MNKLTTFILSIAVLAFTVQARAVTIAGIENVNLLDGNGNVLTSNNEFITVTSTASGFVPANDPTISEVLTDSGDPAMATYVLSLASGAYIDISFGDVVTGLDQLVFFFAGGVNTSDEVIIDFGLDIDAGGPIAPVSNITPFIPLDGDGMVTYITDVDGYTYTLTAAVLDLSTFGLAPGDSLDTFRIYLGTTNSPALSGVGYITGAAVVPLPVPVLLLASGLGAIGLFGRRKSANH